jgi:Leucine-rich repeat (LRR) protein
VAAAEAGWVEDVGGTLIRDSAGRITGVNLRGRWVTEVDLRELAQLPHLTHLDLSLTRVTDEGMLELKNAPSIVDLNLHYAELVTDEGMSAIKGWKKLKRLNVRGAKISDTTLEHISAIQSLESVDIGFALVTDVGLERLTSLPNLKELSFGGNEMGDMGLQALRQMPGLTLLDVSGKQGTDSNLWSVSMTDVGFEAVLTLKELRELRLGCSTMGVGVEGTRFATVSTMNVTANWLARMKALPKLEILKLQSCDRVGDDAIPALAALPNLREVDLKGTAVTDKGLAQLSAAKPKLRIYHGSWVAPTASFRNN